MPRRYSYPENLLSAMHLNEETQRMISYDALTDDQRKGLEYALSALSEREQIVLREHFCEGIGYRAVGLHYNLSESRTRSIIRDALCWLCKNPAWLYYITDGFEARPHICGSSSRWRNKSIVNAAALPLRRICIIRDWTPCICPLRFATRLAGTV